MLQFFKYVLATIVGLLLFFFISIFLIAGVASAVSSSSEEKTEIKSNSVLKLDLNQEIHEIAPDNDPFSALIDRKGSSKTSIVDIKSALANAKIDPNIKGIYLQAESPQAGYATLEEIRNALIGF